ncbi:MAG: helix-turn-helix transcriptional regulator [Aquisalimonadaceae bacterium]
MKQFSDEQIIGVLRESRVGEPVAEPYRNGHAVDQEGVSSPAGGSVARETLQRQSLMSENARLRRLLRESEFELRQSRAALDGLALGVWLLDCGLRCRWMNAAAMVAMRTGEAGLGLRSGRLVLADATGAARLRVAVAAIADGGSTSEIIRVVPSGAALLLLAHGGAQYPADKGHDDGLLAYLIDPKRPVTPDLSTLRGLYALTAAEIRLVAEFLRRADLGVVSTRLGISLHTARTQLKSVMRKTGTDRQAELMRELLLGSGSLQRHGE